MKNIYSGWDNNQLQDAGKTIEKILQRANKFPLSSGWGNFSFGQSCKSYRVRSCYFILLSSLFLKNVDWFSRPAVFPCWKILRRVARGLKRASELCSIAFPSGDLSIRLFLDVCALRGNCFGMIFHLFLFAVSIIYDAVFVCSSRYVIIVFRDRWLFHFDQRQD